MYLFKQKLIYTSQITDYMNIKKNNTLANILLPFVQNHFMNLNIVRSDLVHAKPNAFSNQSKVIQA